MHFRQVILINTWKNGILLHTRFECSTKKAADASSTVTLTEKHWQELHIQNKLSIFLHSERKFQNGRMQPQGRTSIHHNLRANKHKAFSFDSNQTKSTRLRMMLFVMLQQSSRRSHVTLYSAFKQCIIKDPYILEM